MLGLSVIEKVISFGGNRRLPLRLVCGVEEVADAGAAARDTPASVPLHRFGTMMPGLLMYGTIMTVAGWDLHALIAARAGVRVSFVEGAPFNRLIASVRDPASTAQAIRAALA